MKPFSKIRAAVSAIGLCAVAAALGCPVYSDDSIVAVRCVYATDCPLGYRCTVDGSCILAPPLGEGDAGMSAETGGDATIEGGSEDAPGDSSAADALLRADE